MRKLHFKINSSKKIRIFTAILSAASICTLFFFNYLKINQLSNNNQYLHLENNQLTSEISELKNTNKEISLKNHELSSSIKVYQQKIDKSNSFTGERIKIRKTNGGGYVMLIDEKPFLMKGVGYSPIPIGKGYTHNFFDDENKPWLVDGELMKELGINCVRIYSTGDDIDKVKDFIHQMYERFGIYTIVGDWLGLWDNPAANYSDKKFQDKTIKRVLKIVKELKDEKGLLMWVLGNENNYTFTGRIMFWTSPEIEKIEKPYQKQLKRAKIYYEFVNRLAQEIKKIDKNHPVCLGNGEANFLNIASELCQDIDILAIIIYRGKTFGGLFTTIQNYFDKPIFLAEFGCDSFNAYTDQEDQVAQSEFILSQWNDLYKNTVFSGNSKGNCIGGCLFEWNDEWWKNDEGYSANWDVHNKEAGWSHGSYFYDINAVDGLNMNEEWFGIISLEAELDNGINIRTPKKSFYALKDFFSSLSVDY